MPHSYCVTSAASSGRSRCRAAASCCARVRPETHSGTCRGSALATPRAALEAGAAAEVYLYPDVGQVTVIPLVETVAAGERVRFVVEQR